MTKNKMNNKAKIPTLCEACYNMIEIGQNIVRHHLTYFPEKILTVHAGCHIMIHNANPKFPHLKPNPAQVRRWYRKKGSTYSDYPTEVSDYKWYWFWDCIDNGFMTQERKEKIQNERLELLHKEWERIRQIEIKMNVKHIWNSNGPADFGYNARIRI